MAHKLDIFETLGAIDKHDIDFFEKLTDDEKKGFAPPVVLRWASAVSGPMEERYLWLVNERANIHFWDLVDHPELQYKLIASCGVGRSQRHQWIPMAGGKRKQDQLRSFIANFWPNANDMELEILLNQFTEETFEEFAMSSGYLPEEIKEIIIAYGRHIGKVPAKKTKKGSKKGT